MMQVHRKTDALPPFIHAVLTIGTFDGVHTGHQQVIAQMKKEAAAIQGETVIVTFDPHPRNVIRSNSDLRLINTISEKTELLARQDIDHLVIVPFTERFSKMPAGEYIAEFLVSSFHPHTIIIGYDHHFGQARLGNFAMLNDLSAQYNYRLKEIPAHVLNSISVSSTRIRHAIGMGEMDVANTLLGYNFFFTGTVVEGNRLGRTLGYPTANLIADHPEKIIPGDGVYAVDAIASDRPEELLQGMMNIGVRPTVDGLNRVIEINLFDFDRDIYGHQLRVILKRRLRGEQKFSGLDALKAQLAMDKINAQS